MFNSIKYSQLFLRTLTRISTKKKITSTKLLNYTAMGW